jgi:gamma-glutamylaminecyclotransferase
MNSPGGRERRLDGGRLFVFGTLKRGFPLAPALDGARYLGAFRTVERYPMLVAGEWFAPMLLPQPGRGEHVAGELYEVTRGATPYR